MKNGEIIGMVKPWQRHGLSPFSALRQFYLNRVICIIALRELYLNAVIHKNRVAIFYACAELRFSAKCNMRAAILSKGKISSTPP
jgi:hypothetical protein